MKDLSRTGRGAPCWLVASLCLCVFWSALAAQAPEAQAQRSPAVSKRLSHLSRMMRDNDFRVRTQAAFSLGRLGDSSALELLSRGLRDRHPAVRAAAAVSIGRLGDRAALPTLRAHQDSSEAVRSQVVRAISVLEANPNQAASSAGPVKLDWRQAHHYLELGSIANVSKTKRPGLDDKIRAMAWREMRRLPGYVVADADTRPAQAQLQIKRNGLGGYFINVSLSRLVRYMAPNKVRVKAEVLLTVITFPSQVYKMSVNGEGSITIGRSAFEQKQIPALQEDALSGAIQAAFHELDQELEARAAKNARARRLRAERRHRRSKR